LCTYLSWFLLPVYDRLWNPIRIPDFKIIFEVISKLFLSVFYVPHYFSNNFSISGHFVLFFFLTLSIIFILLIFLNFFNKRNILINSNFYLVTNFLFVLFFLITTHHTWRHYYIFSIFSYFFAAKLISLEKKEKARALNHINKRDQWFQYTLKKFFTFTLIISCLGNFLISSGDVKFNFSNSKNLSAHLKFKKISCSDVLTYPGYAVSSWTVYYNEECKNFFLENYKQNSFYSLKGVDRQPSHYFKYYEDLILSSNKNYLVLLCQENCNQERIDLIKIIKIRETDMSIFNEPFLRNDYNEKFILAKLR
jgi:hypothetical protein